MKVDHDNSILSLPGRPRGTIFDARRIITLIAKEDDGFLLQALFAEFIDMFGKCPFIGDCPDPFDFVFYVAKGGHIVDPVADIETFCTILFFPALLQIDDHSPPFPNKRTWGR